jgi:CheY-like chemotaxis protein
LPSVETAVSALRHGAVDFLAKPFTLDEFLRPRSRRPASQRLHAKSESRVDRLRLAVRRLNDARRLVTRKVDLLCNDLVAAYGDLSRQLDLVRTTESFRGVVVSSDDLEQMLCHAMDWILRQIGYANVAIWLAGPESDFQLGAYMKYTIAGEPALTEAMRDGLLQVLRRDGMLHLNPDEAAKLMSPAELRFLRNQAVLGIHCTYLGESIASIVLFREGAKPFTSDDAATSAPSPRCSPSRWRPWSAAKSTRTMPMATSPTITMVRSWTDRMILLPAERKKTIPTGGSAASRRRSDRPNRRCRRQVKNRLNSALFSRAIFPLN